MMQKSRHRRLDKIAVEKQAFLYLTGLMREQRGCKPLSDEAKEKVWNRRKKTSDGMAILDDDSMGGGDGTYYGRWTSWNCNDLKHLLSEAGYGWKDLPSEEQDIIDVYI